jgi:hypothetical protein
MDATYIVVALTAWCVISIPAAFVIGSVIAVGTTRGAETVDVKQAA